MAFVHNILFFLFLLWTSGISNGYYCFPESFIFGTGSSAFQIEGAWNEDGKGESVIDHIIHNDRSIKDTNNTHDVSTDHYHKYKSDVQLLKSLGVKMYRFSISWTRILPNGSNDSINQAGLAYYNDLIDTLLENGIEPLVTMYHFDLPQALQDIGGWSNPNITDYFLDYAKILFDAFGDRVKYWVTLNEPGVQCRSINIRISAPKLNTTGYTAYICARQMLIAHAKAYKLYQSDYKEKYGGQLGVAEGIDWAYVNSSRTEDEQALQRYQDFYLTWIFDPIFSRTGDFSLRLRKTMDQISEAQGLSESRLPTFTDAEKEMINGSADFLGLNHYSTFIIESNGNKIDKNPTYKNDVNFVVKKKPEWIQNDARFGVVPEGFRALVNFLSSRYNYPKILVLENGFVSISRDLNDELRIYYIKEYLTNLWLAIFEDGCNVLAYFYWSFLDSFELTAGFLTKLGLFDVEFSSPEKTRTARDSAKYYSAVARTGCLTFESSST